MRLLIMAPNYTNKEIVASCKAAEAKSRRSDFQDRFVTVCLGGVSTDDRTFIAGEWTPATEETFSKIGTMCGYEDEGAERLRPQKRQSRPVVLPWPLGRSSPGDRRTIPTLARARLCLSGLVPRRAQREATVSPSQTSRRSLTPLSSGSEIQTHSQ